MSNYAEWRAGTIPTDAASALRMLPPLANGSSATISWQSVTNVIYYLQRGSNFSGAPSFSTIQSNILGQAGVTSFGDTDSPSAGAFYYRVGVQ
jgi:hypothetical protein